MKVLVITDNLMTRTQLEGTWKNAGIEIVNRGNQPPDLVAVDLGSRDALESIRELSVNFPAAEVIAFGPHVDGEAFKQAREAGSTKQVARGKVVEMVLNRLGKESS